MPDDLILAAGTPVISQGNGVLTAHQVAKAHNNRGELKLQTTASENPTLTQE